MRVLVHLSDLHIDEGERSRSRARATVDFVRRLPGPISVVLVTGDLADNGEPSEYEFVRDLLDGIDVPVVTCMGNHDARGPYRTVFLGEDDAPGPINRVHDVDGITYAMCDSSIPERDHGHLDDETLEWLDNTLGEKAGRPAFVCFHHPPMELGSPFIDGVRQFESERLAAVVKRHDHVVALLCGHAHTPGAFTFAHRPTLVAPGIVSTLRFPWEGQDGFDMTLPPALAFHVLDDHGRLVTHYRLVPQDE
jgi:3',5'-cyclic-AMP phosphodiesterase